MATLAQLADQIQTAVSDTSAATWSQPIIEGWLNQTITEYNGRFPFTAYTEITLTARATRAARRGKG